MNNQIHLIISCPDQTGIVAAVSRIIADLGGNILDADQHSDTDSGWFFMRYSIDKTSLPETTAHLNKKLSELTTQVNLNCQLSDTSQPKRLLILASKTDHCLFELLYQHRAGHLPADIVGVAANHPDLADTTQHIPFHHIPIDNQNKASHFSQIEQLAQDTQADAIILARYMQILPKDFCQRWRGRIINIHHSFLPSFAGRDPYAQAFARGVKLIGATAHFVTETLDEGPIIAQNVLPVSHRHNIKDYKRLGQQVERQVLYQAVKAYCENRVLIHNQKTIVFGEN